MTATLSLSGITHQYAGGVTALRAVSLEVMAGEFAAILGPSGCGKTTLLRFAAGLASPSSGEVRLNSAGNAAPGVSFVFQDATLMPWASVFDNVWLPLRLRGRARQAARAQVDAQLAAMGLTEFASAYPHELSGGMKMRVAIARALVTQPDLLLMDEPFAALDEITRQRLNDDLLALWSARRFTALFVTHSVFEAVYLSQRVLVMSGRPGSVTADIAIQKPYPRTGLWRTQGDFAALCHAVSQALVSSYGKEGRVTQ